MALDETRIVEPLEHWLVQKPYWEQLLWMRCIQQDAISDEHLSECLAQLYAELGLADGELPSPRHPITFSGLNRASSTDSVPSRMWLHEIKDLRGVNALSNECSVSFGPHLTLVFGRNGCGKSGIVRLLANACFSRGQRPILPDLKNPLLPHTLPRAAFLMKDADGSIDEISYVMGIDHPTLKRFSVFDEQSVHIHLDARNRVNFVPSTIAVFDKVGSAIAKIERALNDERNSQMRSNPFAAIFSGGSESSVTKSACLDLRATTDAEAISAAISFDATNQARLIELEDLIARKKRLDVPTARKRLKEESEALRAAHAAWSATVAKVSPEAAQRWNELVRLSDEQKQVVSRLGLQDFADEVIVTIGTDHWRSFLRAAKSLYDAEHLKLGYEPSHCILCHQAVGDRERILFRKYWALLEDAGERELIRLQTELDKLATSVNQAKLQLPQLSEPDPIARMILEDKPLMFQSLQQGLRSLHEVVEGWSSAAINREAIDATLIPSVDLSALSALADEKLSARESLKDPTEEIAALEKELVELTHRRLAAPLRKSALEYLAYLQWESKVASLNIASLKARTTRKRTEAFLAGVASHYSDLFNAELRELGCDFSLILSTSGEQGNTVKSYSLDFSDEHPPTQVLSEGEQNACSLADFLAEAQLDPNNCGIVLDDPVSSLDLERKSRIAERLVKEARNRQVVIFTHDVPFMTKLVDAASTLNVPFEAHWIKKTATGAPGAVYRNRSPKLALVATLKSDAKAAVQDFKELDPKAQERALATAYDYLRSACEGLVEEYLFGKTICRFDDHVKISNLEEAVYDYNLGQRVVDLHASLSALVLAHNQSDENRGDTVDLERYQSELEVFEALEADLRAAQKLARNERIGRRAVAKEARGGW